MNEGRHTRTRRRSFGRVLYWTVGVLLITTLLSAQLLSTTYARYVTTGQSDDSARVASGGVETIEVLEHEAVLTKGEYVVDKAKTRKTNTYDQVLPGVDIEKDPFIRLKINAEVDYWLYIEVTETNFPEPKTVTYKLRDEWEKTEKENVYRYKAYFDAGQTYDFTAPGEEIYIIKDDTLYVSDQYTGGEKFSLSFRAWLEQVD